MAGPVSSPLQQQQQLLVVLGFALFMLNVFQPLLVIMAALASWQVQNAATWKQGPLEPFPVLWSVPSNRCRWHGRYR